MISPFLLWISLAVQPCPQPEYYDYQFEECFPSQVWREMLDSHPDFAEDDEFGLNHLTDAEFRALTARQLISYYSYPEVSSQFCEGEENPTTRMGIGVFMMDSELNADHSTRQDEALRARRDSVLWLVNECAMGATRYPEVLKEIVITVGAWEQIPHLIRCYGELRIKESTYLTVLVRLMADAEWKPFLQSRISKEIEHGEWEIPFNDANEALILKLARQYHAAKRKGE